MKKIFFNLPFKKIAAYAKAHKIIAGLIAAAVLGGGWWAYASLTSTEGETRYVLGTVSRGTIVASVSASGQVSSSDEVDIKPKASGDVTWVGVKAGTAVYAGQTIATLDNTDAKQAVAEAEADLARAKLEYQQDAAQAPIDYEETVEALEDAKDDLTTEYNDVYNAITDAYLDLPSVMTDAEGVLYDFDFNTSQWNIAVFRGAFTDGEDWTTMSLVTDDAEADYKAGRTAYDTSLLEYKSLSRYSSNTELESFLDTSIDTTTAVAEAVSGELTMLDTYVDIAEGNNQNVSSTVASLQSGARSNLSTVNGLLSALLAQKKALETAKRGVRDKERAIEVYVIGNPGGGNPISLQSSAQSIASEERELAELRAALADYVITAPFAGTIAALDVKRYDSVTTGSSVATLITAQRIATLSLNEVDVAKVQLGNKATLTFDAVEELTLTGDVVEIDAVGSVSQGVVSYELKVAFDTQDERIKPGMTANATIATEVKQNVLIVPSGAVKTQNGASFVQMFEPALESDASASSLGVTTERTPQQVMVEIGISDDDSVEIISGLAEGQQIVTRTISGTAAAVNTQTASSNGNVRSMGGPTGGATFIAR